MGAWGLPALNTVLLLSSGVTITFAHWSLIANNRGKLLALAGSDHRCWAWRSWSARRSSTRTPIRS